MHYQVTKVDPISIESLSSKELITELWRRNVSEDTIRGSFYALDAIADHEDEELERSLDEYVDTDEHNVEDESEERLTGLLEE